MIRIRRLRKVFPPDKVALDGVDLDIAPGEFVMVIGQSGAGKSTLLRCLNRLVEPTGGEVQLNGSRVTGASPDALRGVRRQMGMIFQQFNLVRRATVLENVLAGRLGHVPGVPSLFGRFPRHDREIALACLKLVELDYALFFVAAVGLGPFPGILAVVTYTTMTLAKLYSEAIEGIEPGPVEAISATGANRLQILRFGIFPQVVPLFASYVLYRLETNIRAATILGFVGAGGIGFYIQTYLRMINYPAAAAVLLVLVAMIMAVDFTSSRLRAHIV